MIVTLLITYVINQPHNTVDAPSGPLARLPQISQVVNLLPPGQTNSLRQLSLLHVFTVDGFATLPSLTVLTVAFIASYKHTESAQTHQNEARRPVLLQLGFPAGRQPVRLPGLVTVGAGRKMLFPLAVSSCERQDCWI